MELFIFLVLMLMSSTLPVKTEQEWVRFSYVSAYAYVYVAAFFTSTYEFFLYFSKNQSLVNFSPGQILIRFRFNLDQVTNLVPRALSLA